MKTIQQLAAQLKDVHITGDAGREITSLAYDSRAVKPGALFVALAGSKADGHDFVAAACRQGAAAVLIDKDVPVDPGVVVLKVPDSRAAMLSIAPYFYDYPSRKLRLIGVTGTNGKTTTTHLIRAILRAAGYRVGLIGTIHTVIGEKTLPVKNTTPDVIDLQALFADMVVAGVTHVIMEVSSHAIALGRISGSEFDTGVYTNITRDHLDFHHTFENYIAAKAELFSLVSAPGATKGNKAAVVNTDDPAAAVMLAACRCRQLTYGVENPADLTAAAISVRARGASFTVKGPFGDLPLALKITGVFNVYNVLAAVGAALVEGVSPAVVKQALEEFASVPGRFELVDAGQPYTVIVDYAHTPDGLENILRTARQFATRRIIVVFGCGGDRDRTKRPIMGRLAMDYGDIVIATSDNPRSEDPAAILAEVEVGLKEKQTAAKGYEIIVDRRTAIARALRIAEPDDVVVIAGKGHETYQVLKDKTIDFDDRAVAREIIKELN
ncbi:UDP-N-acetylmuramoyl-L-alanyl-D-glutamate--2,6-diaminopimelate ligase [Anaeroselena agilis]|uniref:UDP-N-acetylmuramoyl-L-alanyl-D-glutamate--2,6-diaminopimelate ligase n=1 Tax=Anaeroselena agilis TaxID=3063788 RepID=A0ABU3NY08_9FIRM|nr:UDP-N-acetylmuramoyl-L-alanyl-D-glutamate--2,6-diaminopimelate ligase [Selenomonadales bacterium 4137-cl]